MAAALPIDFVTGAPTSGDLQVRWLHGSRSPRPNRDPGIQVHAFDAHTFILRQSMAASFEAPFLYLFCGNSRALLLDTGATSDPDVFPLRETVDRILADWLEQNPRDPYELVVAHTHDHSDHVAGDPQFVDRPMTTTVGRDLAAVQTFFGISAWPEQAVRLDLGGRDIEVTGCPGHHESSIAVFDRWSGFLVTGDTVYPGRLYVNDFPAFSDSLDRLVDLAESRTVRYVMGCHIEMTRTPGRDYPLGCSYQPEEADLPMAVSQLVAVRDAARSVANRPGAHVFDDFIIFHGSCRRAVLIQISRTLAGKLRDWCYGLSRGRHANS